MDMCNSRFLSLYFCRSKKLVQNTRRKDIVGKSTEYLSKNCVLCTEHFGHISHLIIEGACITISPIRDLSTWSFLTGNQYCDIYWWIYIVRRIRDKVCEECRSKVSSSICPEDLKHAFLSIKNYSGAKEGLLAPSTSLVQLLILHLMINIRLHHTIKRNNLMLRDETTRKNRKTLTFSHL